MRGSLTPAIGLLGLCLFGAIQPAFAENCRDDLKACVAASRGHPHICDPLVRNLPTCEANERKGIQQGAVDPKYTKAAIAALYNLK